MTKATFSSSERDHECNKVREAGIITESILVWSDTRYDGIAKTEQ